MLILGILGLFALLLVPGLLTVRLLRGSLPEDMNPGERLYVGLILGFYLVSWIAIVLAEFGRMRPAWLLAITGVYCVAVAVTLLPRGFDLRSGLTSIRRGWRSLLPFCFVFAILPLHRPFEYILGGRDPGVYVNAGAIMSETGSVAFSDPLVERLPDECRGLFLGEYSSHGILTTERLQGFWYASKPLRELVPQGMHLFPAWMGVTQWILGYPGFLWFIPLTGLISLLGIYHFTARFAGAAGAVIATSLLLLSPIHLYFSRYPCSEILVQAFIWSALLLFLLFEKRPSRVTALVAGAGLGLSILVRIDSLLLVVPVCLVLAYYFLFQPERRQIVFFGIGFSIPAAHAALHVWFISRPYVLSIVNVLKIIPALAQVALPGFIIVLLMIYLFRSRIRRTCELAAGSTWLHAALSVAVGSVVWFAAFYRPRHPAGYWDLGNVHSFVYFRHYMGIAATALFVAALLYASHSSKSRSILLTFLVMTHFGFYFYRLQIYPELIWAMRRLVPVIWPASFVLIGLLISVLWSIRRCRVFVRAATALAIAVVLWETLPATRFHWFAKEYEGAVKWVDAVSKLTRPNDVLLFEPRFQGSLQTLSLPLWAIHHKNVLQFVFGTQPTAQLEAFLDFWRSSQGGRVFVLTQNGVEIASLRYRPRFVREETISLPYMEQVYDGFPRTIVPMNLFFKMYELVPEPPNRTQNLVDVGGQGDDLLLSYFFGPERLQDLTYRWSTYKGGVFLPGFSGETKAIEIRFTPGPRPENLARPYCVFYLGRTQIGVVWPSPDWVVYRFDVPERVRENARNGGPISLSFKVSPFTPRETISGSDDPRSLGLCVDYVKLID